MTLNEAKTIIDEKYLSGSISLEESKWLIKMVRRTRAYGNRLSCKRQKQMRANLLRDL